MAARRQKSTAAGTTANPRVHKRARRAGPKRALNLVLLDDLALRLEILAARRRTTPSEIVMDWIVEKTRPGAVEIPAEEERTAA